MGYRNTNIPQRRMRRLSAIGDLDQKIKLQQRTLNSSVLTGRDDSTFADVAPVWAQVNTKRGLISLDGAEQKKEYSHEFTIRYRELTQETFVLYNNNRYDILDVENLDERNEYLKLRCAAIGTKDVESTWG